MTNLFNWSATSQLYIARQLVAHNRLSVGPRELLDSMHPRFESVYAEVGPCVVWCIAFRQTSDVFRRTLSNRFDVHGPTIEQGWALRLGGESSEYYRRVERLTNEYSERHRITLVARMLVTNYPAIRLNLKLGFTPIGAYVDEISKRRYLITKREY